MTRGVLHRLLGRRPRRHRRGARAAARWRRARRATGSCSQRSPTPLLLHRNGVIVDANEAAARAVRLRRPRRDDRLRPDLLGRREPPLDRERRAPRGARAHAGRRRRCRSPTSAACCAAAAGCRCRPPAVRVEADGGPATLSIYVRHHRARSAPRTALRRSEALLSHLFATSPDCITLTELDSGRYAMVNEAFERVTGYTPHEVVGRTAAELGIWLRPEDRDAARRRAASSAGQRHRPAGASPSRSRASACRCWCRRRAS